MKTTFLYQSETIKLVGVSPCDKCMFPPDDCRDILIRRNENTVQTPADHLCKRYNKHGFFTKGE